MPMKVVPWALSWTCGAFCRAGISVRMFIMPTCGLFGGSGRFPVAQAMAHGGPATSETR